MRNRLFIVGSVLLPLLLLCGLAVWSRDSSRELVKSSRWIVHTHRVERELERVQSEVLNAERTERGYLLSGQSEDLKQYKSAIAQVPASLTALHALVRAEDGQEKNFVRLNSAITSDLHQLNQAVSLLNTGNHTAAIATVGSLANRATSKEVLQTTPVMLQQEEELLKQRESRLSGEVLRNEHLALWIAIVYSILAGGIACLLWRWAKLRNFIRVSAWSKTVEVDGEYLSFEEYLQKVYRVDGTGENGMVAMLADELDPRRRF